MFCSLNFKDVRSRDFPKNEQDFIAFIYATFYFSPFILSRIS